MNKPLTLDLVEHGIDRLDGYGLDLRDEPDRARAVARRVLADDPRARAEFGTGDRAETTLAAYLRRRIDTLSQPAGAVTLDRPC